MFDDLIEGNGGSTNGYTTRDFTAYLNNFPREALPVVLDLEAIAWRTSPSRRRTSSRSAAS